MDAGHDVDGTSPEYLRQEIRQTTRTLKHDVERLQGVVRDGAERARHNLFTPDFVRKGPLRACAIAMGLGFLASRMLLKRHEAPVSRRVVAGTGIGLREIGIAAVTRAIQGALFRR
jgi:hypothetical protein